MSSTHQHADALISQGVSNALAVERVVCLHVYVYMLRLYYSVAFTGTDVLRLSQQTTKGVYCVNKVSMHHPGYTNETG